jgi:hypothetical protein
LLKKESSAPSFGHWVPWKTHKNIYKNPCFGYWLIDLPSDFQPLHIFTGRPSPPENIVTAVARVEQLLSMQELVIPWNYPKKNQLFDSQGK